MVSEKVIIPPFSVGFKPEYPPIPLLDDEFDNTGVFPLIANSSSFPNLYALVGCISKSFPMLNNLITCRNLPF